MGGQTNCLSLCQLEGIQIVRCEHCLDKMELEIRIDSKPGFGGETMSEEQCRALTPATAPYIPITILYTANGACITITIMLTVKIILQRKSIHRLQNRTPSITNVFYDTTSQTARLLEPSAKPSSTNPKMTTVPRTISMSPEKPITPPPANNNNNAVMLKPIEENIEVKIDQAIANKMNDMKNTKANNMKTFLNLFHVAVLRDLLTKLQDNSEIANAKTFGLNTITNKEKNSCKKELIDVIVCKYVQHS